MTFPRSTESAYRRIAPPAGADDFERYRAVVTAMIMLDVLITIKEELTKNLTAEGGGAGELQTRINRVEAAISDLRRVVGVADVAIGESAKPRGRVETTLCRAPVSER
jgi:hypothetical protein